MKKVITHIDCPKEWGSENDWDSHRPLLYLACENSYAGIVEFGSGDGSTELLRKFCKISYRDGFSFDNNKFWCEKTKSRYVEDYMGVDISGEIGLMFIDAAPAEIRKLLISKYKDIPVMVIHDTEPGAEYVYGMNEVLSSFKYRLDYQPEGKPHTTAVSNYINVCEWVK